MRETKGKTEDRKKEYPGFMVVEWDIAKPGNRRRDPCACEPEQNDSAFIPFATRPAYNFKPAPAEKP